MQDKEKDKKKEDSTAIVKNESSENELGEEMEIIKREMMMYSGPIPHPALFADFEKALPGLADRVMKMSESQTKHRQKIESRVIFFDLVKSWMGLIFAFLIVIAGFAAATYLILKDKDASGLAVGIVPLGAIIGTFIWQRRGGGEEVSGGDDSDEELEK